MEYTTWLEIDLSKVKKNIAGLRSYIKPETKVLAVVKNDAYGHGLVEIAKTAELSKVDYIGVSNIEEGLILRKAKITIPILVMAFPGFDLIREAVEEDLELAVWDKDFVRNLSIIAREVGKPAKVHIKVDTGMNRYGISKNEAVEFAVYLKRQPKINLIGVFSHFASAESRDKSYTFKQLGAFQECIESLKNAGFDKVICHIANSAAALSMTSTHFDMVRLGITIYGLFPTPELGTFFELEPVLSWKTKIAQIKKVSGGEKIGYGGDYQTMAPTHIAVIPVGYGNGYDRHLSNVSKVLVGEKRIPVIGKISMNSMTIDVSGVENPKVGDEVILIGKQGEETITAGELAGYLDTINYEIVTRINPTIPKLYIK